MKTPYAGNFSKLTPDKHKAIANLYAGGTRTTESIATLYGVSTRQVQRIAKKFEVLRSQAESNKLMAPLKHYYVTPPEQRVVRKQLRNWLRLDIIQEHPWCSICGATVKDGIRLEVDHIDEDPANNDPKNLQVLCGPCNRGKSHKHRFGDRG